MRPANLILSALAVPALILAGVLIFSPNTLKKQVFAQAMPTDYFAPYQQRIAPALYQVSGPVYAYEHGFTRSLVVDTGAGLAVIDTFGEEHAVDMKAALAEKFPGQAVRWVIFSHNHLDHVRGSSLFTGAEIIGHTDINMLVKDWPKAGKSVARVTRPLMGDEALRLGNITIDALYMPYSHSHTLYGFYVRGADVVFAADMMFVKAVPPFDFPDFYHPGYVRALDRLIALNAAHYVPSHTDRGTRDDLIAYRGMVVLFEDVIKIGLLARGVEAATDGYAAREVLKESYDILYEDYGDWHGFDAMFVPKFGRHYGGTYLGY